MIVLNPLEERLLGVLLAVGRFRSTIVYRDLAALLGMNMTYSSDRAKLGRMLGNVGVWAYAEWKILPNVLAVNLARNVPSGGDETGFYGWCAENGIEASRADPLKLILNEQRKVFNFLDA